MAINFPTTLDTLTNPSASSDTAALSHAGQHSDVNDAIEALEAKVGANGSSVTTSLDYLVKNTSSIDPGHKHTVANLSDTTISSPTNGQALTYDSATSKWVNTAVSAADASTTVKGSTKLSVAPVSSSNPIAVGDNDTRVPTQAENDALAGTAGTPSASNKYVTNDDTGTSGANKVLRLNGSGALPAVSGANLTSLPSSLTAKNGTTTYDLATASGNQIIPHGLGKTPKLVRFTYYSDSTSGTPWITWGSGAYNGTDNTSVWMTSSETMVFQSAGSSSGASLYVLNSNTSATQTATCTFDATNITLAWVKAGTPNGTVYIMWEAIA